jgi:hypothetical protein
MSHRLSHVIGIDDAPFVREHRGDVLVVGAAFSGLRLEGILSTRVRRDGANATAALAQMIARSQFAEQTQVVLLQGIAVAGFNVVDIEALHRELGAAVLVVARKPPDFEAIRRALLGRVRGGRKKWGLIEKAGLMQPAGGVWVQRAGISIEVARSLISRLAVHGKMPEPLRVAHLVAGGVTTGQSRGRT